MKISVVFSAQVLNHVLKRLAAGFFLRKLVGELHRVGDAVERQNALIERLVEKFAPAVAIEREMVRAETGLSHLDVDDAQLALAYIAKTERDTGRTPDDDEVLIYLADEKTTDLHKRLIDREHELLRLTSER